MHAPRPALALAAATLLLPAVFLVGPWTEPDAAPLLAPTREAPSAPAIGSGYACPPGGETPFDGGVCARRFAGLFDYLVEPELAVSPLDPRVMALAANDGQSVDGVAHALEDELAVRMQRFALFVTDDGGETWDEVVLPPAPPPPAPVAFALPDTQWWDPTLAFDDEGRLHVAGVLVWAGADGSGKQRRVFHLSTDDLGASWSGFTILGARVDRPWMSIAGSGAIDLVWWETADTTLGFARSLDGGATWSELAPSAPKVPCYFPSIPVELDGAVHLACVRDERFASSETDPPRGVYRYDAATNAFAMVGPLPAMSTPALYVQPDGALVLVAGEWNVSDIMVLRSENGGASWSRAPNLRDRLAIDDAWSFLQHMGGRADPWGNVEIFVRGVALPPRPDLGPVGPFLDLPTWLGNAYADNFAVGHVVLDPATGDVVSEARLTSAVPNAPGAAVGAGVGRAGDYYGLGFADDHAVLVWEYQRALYLTHWRP